MSDSTGVAARFHRAGAAERATAPQPDAISRLLLDKSVIADLVALYAIAVDDCDGDTAAGMFTEDGEFERAGTVHSGRDELAGLFNHMGSHYRISLHIPNTLVVRVDGDTASGLATGQAQLVESGQVLLAAYRYADVYRRTEGGWLFARRSLKFLYVVPALEFDSSLRSPLRIRRSPGQAETADLPEVSPGGREFPRDVERRN